MSAKVTITVCVLEGVLDLPTRFGNSKIFSYCLSDSKNVFLVAFLLGLINSGIVLYGYMQF